MIQTTLLMAGPGAKLQEALGSEIGSLFLLAVTAISLWHFWQRNFTAFLGFALFALFVGVFIFSPEYVRELGTDAFRWLFVGWFENLN
mgnify:CR=1 FL=1|jgi:hypothetical protein